MIPASLNMPIMTGGDAIAPPQPMKFDPDTLGSGLQLGYDNTIISLVSRTIANGDTYVTYNGSSCCGNSQKSTGKWQYTLRCTASQVGNNSLNQRSFCSIGLSKRNKSVITTVGMANYDFALYSYCYNNSSVGTVYKVSNKVYTSLYSGEGSSNSAGDYITILVDFDSGKVWFAVNGTVLGGGNPNAGTGESFSFAPNTGLVPAVTLATNSLIRTPGTYLVEQSIIYPTWPSFQLWDDQDETASDDPLTYDPNTADNSLLIVTDGIANGTTTLTDLSSYAHAITNNLATVNATDDVLNGPVEPIGTGSLAFDGNDAFTTTPMTQFNFGTSNFTIEFYFKRASLPVAGEVLYDSRNSAAESFITSINLGTNGTIRVRYSGADRLTSITNICDGFWHHVAFSRDGDTLRLFIDGIEHRLVTGALTANFTSNALRFGSSYVPSTYFNGSINFVRITKGLARYVSSFLPPRFWLSS